MPGSGAASRARRSAWQRRVRWAGLAVAALSWSSSAAAQVGYTGSIYFGKMETSDGERTDAVYLINAVDVQRGRVRVSATIPWVLQRSRWTDAALGPVESSWQSGLSDPTFRIDAEAWRSRGRQTRLRVGGAVKVPVADVESGFSSGETDVAMSLSLSTARGRDSLFADVTFWLMNDAPDAAYRDVPTFYVGYARVLDRGYRWSGLVSVGGGPSVIAGIRAPVQVSAALLRLLGAKGAFGISLDVGVTSGAADYAVASTWRFTF